MVISPLKDSPAEKAGVLPGDIITHVDGVSVSNKSLEGAISLIRGEVGSEVTLSIVRAEEEESLELKVLRDIVRIPVLDTEIIEGTFVIHLYNFNEQSEKLFKEAMHDFKDSGTEKLIIDLRNNPGGYLTSAVDIAGYFLPQGTIVLREHHGLGEEDEVLYRSAGYDLLSEQNFKTLVLINQGSASAAEILAGALRDNGYAEVVGERSFGKGSVQEFIQLPEKTSLKITVAKWLTPNSEQISTVGIEPDVYIPFNSESDEDLQLLRAIQLFNK